jgi:hypothetical protein
MSIGLSIVFTGLCALVGDGDGRPAEILLVDTTGVGEVGGVMLPAHAPTLALSLNDLANPDSSAPTRVVAGRPDAAGRVDQIGLWDLTGSEVRIRVQGAEATGVRFFQPSAGQSAWPQPPRDPDDAAAWRDIRYVANMKDIVPDARIDPALIADGPLPRAAAARIRLDSGLVQGAIPSQKTYRADLFHFTGNAAQTGKRQALTDTIQWTLHADATAVVIEIVPAQGGPAKRLLLAPSARPHRVFVSNLPVDTSAHEDEHAAMSDGARAALHFGAYYKLLMNEPADPPRPALSPASSDRKGAGLMRPFFCPPAVFSRP